MKAIYIKPPRFSAHHKAESNGGWPQLKGWTKQEPTRLDADKTEETDVYLR